MYKYVHNKIHHQQKWLDTIYIENFDEIFYSIRSLLFIKRRIDILIGKWKSIEVKRSSEWSASLKPYQ